MLFKKSPEKFWDLISTRYAASAISDRTAYETKIEKIKSYLSSEDVVLAEAEAIAIKQVIAFQLGELMKKKKLTKTQLAKRMNTSRSSLERLLDPDNASVTLLTLERAAKALGKRIKIELAA